MKFAFLLLSILACKAQLSGNVILECNKTYIQWTNIPRNVELQWSSNLVDWCGGVTILNNNLYMSFTHPVRTNDNKFYRLMSL